MEVRRRIKRNKIINDIRDAETFIKRSEDTIKRIKGSNMGVEYIQNQIEKLKTAIVSKTECLEQLKNELLDVNTGELDDNINDEYKNNTDKHNKQKKERKKANAINTYITHTRRSFGCKLLLPLSLLCQALCQIEFDQCRQQSSHANTVEKRTEYH